MERILNQKSEDQSFDSLNSVICSLRLVVTLLMSCWVLADRLKGEADC